MKNKPLDCNFWFLFQTNCKISNFFTFKDKIPPFLGSAVFTSFSVVAAMLPITCHFKVRTCEHLVISAVTGKRAAGDDDSAIKEHLLFCNHAPDFEDMSILQSLQLGKNLNTKFFSSTFASSKAFQQQTFSCLFLLAACVHDWIILHSYVEKHIFGRKTFYWPTCI